MSAGSYNLLNGKIILFTSGNFYCLLTKLRKSIKVLVVSTCASPIGLSGEIQGNFYKNTKVGVDYIDQILEMFITKFSTRRWPVALTHWILRHFRFTSSVRNGRLKRSCPLEWVHCS